MVETKNDMCRRRGWMRSLYAALFLVGIQGASLAHAGNTRSYLLGDEAAMTGGAGIAVARDSGSLWYNPAGLGGLKLGRMELTGTIYQAKLRTVPNYLKAELPSGSYSEDATANDFGSVPTSLVFVRNANDDVSYGFAWYQTADLWVDYRADLEAPYDEGGDRWRQGMEYHQRGYTYHIGLAVGWQLNPRFRLGASLFFVYNSLTRSYDAFASVGEEGADESELYITGSQYSYEGSIGAMMQFGLQWQFADQWHLAAVVRTPTFKIVSFGDSSYLRSHHFSDSDGFEYETDEFRDWSFKQDIPFEGQLGLVYKTRDLWVGVEAAVRPGLDSKDYRPLWNASIGGRFKVHEKLFYGVGLFTDNSPEKKPSGPFDSQLNRYGISTGIEFRTPLKVRNKDKPDKDLVWATTFAAVYSFEQGEVTTIEMAPRTENFISYPLEDVLFHHGYLHIGTALYF